MDDHNLTVKVRAVASLVCRLVVAAAHELLLVDRQERVVSRSTLLDVIPAKQGRIHQPAPDGEMGPRVGPEDDD